MDYIWYNETTLNVKGRKRKLAGFFLFPNMSINYFPTNSLGFAATAILSGAEVTRSGEYEYRVSPLETAVDLWWKFQRDEISISPRLLTDQIREIRRMEIGGQNG